MLSVYTGVGCLGWQKTRFEGHRRQQQSQPSQILDTGQAVLAQAAWHSLVMVCLGLCLLWQ